MQQRKHDIMSFHSFMVCDINYTVYRCNGKNFMLGSLYFYCYTGNIVEPNIVKSGFCSIQFTVTFAGTQKVDR